MNDAFLRKSGRFFLIVSGLYLLSRLIFFFLGIRFLTTYDFMFWLDLELLQHHLLESLIYTHSFPPAMNALLGVVLKLTPGHPEVALGLKYLSLGLIFILSFTYILDRLLKLNRWLSLLLVSFFYLSPPFIYFENFLLYTFPSAMLLCALAALFHLAIKRKSFRWWLLFFTVCVGLGLLRATFHMLWLLMILAIVLVFEQKQYKTILRAFIAPFGLLLIFYLKNLFIFGFFGVSSWGGFNLSLNTHNRIPLEERQALVSKGELSPIYGFHPYSGPDAYQAIFDLSQERGIPALDQKMRPLGRPNYNHWVYAEVSPMKMRDSWQFIKENPGQYFRTVGFNARQFLGPSTEWHPRGPDFSPHAPHQDIIGGYERLYNSLLHSFPVKGIGVYIFFPWVLLVILISTGISLLKARFKDRLEQKWLFFIGMNCLFVYLASICLTYGEMARYRFLIEPYIIVFYVYAMVWGLRKGKAFFKKN